MKIPQAALIGVVLLLLSVPTSAHRLDEYLQATTISVEKDRVQLRMRLAPGVAVFSKIFASMDTDGNKVISFAEQRAYAARVLGDVSLTINGKRVRLRAASCTFAKTEELKEGRGDIQIVVTAEVPPSRRARTLVFENHHQSRISEYMVNCLVPGTPNLRVTSQTRNYSQSRYQLDYVQD